MFTLLLGKKNIAPLTDLRCYIKAKKVLNTIKLYKYLNINL